MCLLQKAIVWFFIYGMLARKMLHVKQTAFEWKESPCYNVFVAIIDDVAGQRKGLARKAFPIKWNHQSTANALSSGQRTCLCRLCNALVMTTFTTINTPRQAAAAIPRHFGSEHINGRAGVTSIKSVRLWRRWEGSVIFMVSACFLLLGGFVAVKDFSWDSTSSFFSTRSIVGVSDEFTWTCSTVPVSYFAKSPI